MVGSWWCFCVLIWVRKLLVWSCWCFCVLIWIRIRRVMVVRLSLKGWLSLIFLKLFFSFCLKLILLLFYLNGFLKNVLLLKKKIKKLVFALFVKEENLEMSLGRVGLYTKKSCPVPTSFMNSQIDPISILRNWMIFFFFQRKPLDCPI